MREKDAEYVEWLWILYTNVPVFDPKIKYTVYFTAPNIVHFICSVSDYYRNRGVTFCRNKFGSHAAVQ